MEDNLYEKLKKSGLKMDFVAHKLGINRRTLYGKLKSNGNYKLYEKEKKIIRDLLNKINDT